MKLKLKKYQKLIGLKIIDNEIVFHPEEADGYYRLESEAELLQKVYTLGIERGKAICEKRFKAIFK